MPNRDPFLNKLIDRFDKLDPQALQNYVLDLAQHAHQLEEVLDHLQEGVLLLNPEGEITFMNRQAGIWLEKSFPPNGRQPLKKIIEDPALYPFIEEQLKNPQERVTADLSLMIPRELSLRVSVSARSGQRPCGLLVLLMDITREVDQVTWNERWARIESLIHLTAGIAHEIGNPLNAITIHLQLLQKKIQSLSAGPRKEMEDMLEVLLGETHRLDAIIRNFLKATRKPLPRYQNENLLEVIEEALEFMKPELTARKIKLIYRKKDVLTPFLIHKEALYQAFINLIKNAMEAMPHGGKLEITAKQQDKIVTLLFKDTGLGIAQKNLDHIFDAYYTTKPEGSGLGLMTVFQAIRDHGGRIDVESKVNQGTTFTLWLPIRKPKLQIPENKNP